MSKLSMGDRALNDYSATEARALLDSGDIGPADYLDACRLRIERSEEKVCAWEYLAPELPVPGEARAESRPLAGIPVGVKDIYDTSDMPTGWGTSYLRTDRSPCDAAAVALLRRAGAIIPGKTVTTELAFFTPGKTRNPLDTARTPGGSSSGSAAAVADGMVPLALGTQTAGSIIRPASYCGVVGFKPSFGVIPLAGVKSFSPSLDTAGWFARTVEDIALLNSILSATPAPAFAPRGLTGLRVGVRAIPADGPLDTDAARVLADTRQVLLEAGAHVTDLVLPAPYDGLVDIQKRIMAYEAARTLAYEHEHFREQMGPQLVDILDEGLAIRFDHYREAMQDAAWHRWDIAERFAGLDVIMAPGVIGEAPPGHEATGDPLYCRAWTLLGLPCISLPLGTGTHGMPIGVQFIGPKLDDAKLLAIARAVIG